ncbi:hypothetical protein [Nostoc sp.]|uniref:hypothetical protein n=1 Tax=Nostoc sp. TaxID=1180 RepID=UPI002FF602A0
MPTRDWAVIRKSLIATYNPTIASHFGATPSTADNELIQLMTVKSNDSSLIAQSRITLFNQRFPSGDAYAVCPDGWLIRPEYHRPQGIYQFVEVDSTGKVIGSPKYRITIPQHKPQKLQLTQAPIPNYERGSWEIIYVLKDNSRITIHSKDEENGLLVLKAAKTLVDSAYLVGAYQSKSCLVKPSSSIAEITVKCRMAKFYSTGCLSVLPDWIVKW